MPELLTAAPVRSNPNVLSTGHAALDAALGVGGLTRGRFTEFQSQSALATMALALRATAETQARGGIVAFVDGTHALDLELARTLGVNVSELLVSQPDDALMALEIVTHLSRSGAVDLIVVDGLAYLAEEVPPEQARTAISHSLRSLWSSVARTRTCVLFATEPRLGAAQGVATTIRYLSSVRCLVTRIGKHALITVGKNKLAPAFTEASVDLQLP